MQLFGSDKYAKVRNLGILKSTIAFHKDHIFYLLKNSPKSVVKIYLYFILFFFCLNAENACYLHWLFEFSVNLTKVHERGKYDVQHSNFCGYA